MKYDTSGRKICEPIYTCNCGLTGGCNLCRPTTSFIGSITNKEAQSMKEKILEWKKRFNEDFEKRSKELEELFNTPNHDRTKI